MQSYLIFGIIGIILWIISIYEFIKLVRLYRKNKNNSKDSIDENYKKQNKNYLLNLVLIIAFSFIGNIFFLIGIFIKYNI